MPEIRWNDHDGTTIGKVGGGWKVLCRCGWQTDWNSSQDDAESEHDMHRQLAEATAEDFDV